ncbi:MAG: MMPL family transporter [Verrucomicrobiales bacterium]|nr:MMPL family transporter [Verrucomicrobiales bacterium]
MSRILKIALTLLLAAAVATGFARLKFRTDILDLLPAKLPEVAGLKAFLNNFTQRDELILTLSAPDPDTADAATRSLAAALNAAPGLARDVAFQDNLTADPSRAAELVAYLLLNQPPAQVAALTGRLQRDRIGATIDATIDELESGIDLQRVVLLSYDPLGIATQALGDTITQSGGASGFASADGTFRVVYILSGQDLPDYAATAVWIAEIRSLVSLWQSANPGLAASTSIALTGEPAFATEIATGMERDMKRSAATTLVIVALVFLAFYRRLLPLGALVVALGLTLLLTVAAAGLILGGLTVVSLGFASILIGLAIDYGLLIYNRAAAHTGHSGDMLRQSTAPGIGYAAITTSAAFFALAAAGLPALTELGILVGFGILAGAAVMLFAFTPMAARLAGRAPPTTTTPGRLGASRPVQVTASLVVLAIASGIAVNGLPSFELGSGSLRPRNSEAYNTLDLLQNKLSTTTGTTNVIVHGKSLGDVRASLESLSLNAPPGSFVPLPFWPHPDNQQANSQPLAALSAETERLANAVADAGFEPEAFTFTRAVLAQWRAWLDSPPPLPITPASPAASRLFNRFVAMDEDSTEAFALARIPTASVDRLPPGTLPADWALLSEKLATTTRAGMIRMLAVLGITVLLTLYLAFRKLREISLALTVVAIDLATLLGAMAWLGIGWNFINLGALLLALGAGLDYSIHMLFALREESGDTRAACGKTGTALLVCALSTIAGFGTLAFASNLGLASLGLVCALAMAINAIVALFILPALAATANPR